MVPEGWTSTKLGHLVRIRGGVVPSHLETSGKGPIPYLKVEDLNNSTKYQSRSRNYVENAERPIAVNAILFPKRGAAISGNKVRIAQVPNLIDSNMMALEVNAEKADFEFLYYKILDEGLYRIADTSTIPQINNKHIDPYPLALPPLPEQKKIAETLSTWDKAIETSEKLTASAESQKRALMQQLLTGRRRLEGYCGDWRRAKLSGVCTIRKGEQRGRKELEDEGDYPVINGGIEASGYTDEWNAEAGTITISEGGNSCGYVNLIEQRFWSGGHCYTLRDLQVERGYLFFWLKYEQIKIMKLRVGSGLPNIQKGDLSKFEVAVPERREQVAIAEILANAEAQVARHGRDRESLRREKKALMQQLLTGRRRVSV